MNKRKASVDRNAKQRVSSRRPSVSSLYSRSNPAHQKLKPEKSPSSQILPTTEVQNLSKSVQIDKVVETCLPKTRFSSQDRCRELRSYSSPRLKYFPAEKIKKFESPPNTPPIGALIAQQNPYETGLFYVAGPTEQCSNNGQGDTATAVQSLHQHRPPQNVQSVGQQQVAPHPAIHQVAQMNPRSESMIPQQILASQSHRPFVPHGPQDNSPQKALAGVQPTHPAYHNSLCTMATPQPAAHQGPNPAATMADQPRSKSGEPINAAEQPDYDKQPIGGRSSTNYSKMMKQLLPQSQTSMDPNDHQRLHNPYSRHVQFHQTPQQLHQQLQQNTWEQMQMQQRALNYQTQTTVPRIEGQGTPYGGQQLGRYFPGQGMTSPQDVTANQMRTTRQMHQRDLNYSMNPQNGWTKNNQLAEYSSTKAQLKPYNLEVVNNVPQQHHVHQHRQLYENPGQTAVPIMYQQPGFDQRMAPNQQPNVQSSSEKSQIPRNDKKPLQFTVGMLRDQEKLLNTMKQQGVPLDIMRRQFEALLIEQRKHLEYLDHLQRQDIDEETRTAPVNSRRKKNIDEKPEWMAHLTPSRISYLEMERLREQQLKEQEAQQSQQQNTNETGGQQVSLQLQNQPYQSWQPNWQQNGVTHVQNSMYPHPYMMSGMNPGPNSSTMNHHHQQTVPQNQYPPQQYNQQPQQYQAVVQQNQEQTMSSGEFSGYQEVKQPTEPSSLSKMRQYKNEVRPQKRNNGLQDPEVARRQLDELRINAETRKGLEYLANFAPSRPMLKLNGIQDRSETETEIQKRLLVLNSEPTPKQVSANGLENARNPDNPPPRRLANLKRLEQEFLKEYPRQKGNCYNVQAERENGTVANAQQPRLLQQQLPAQNSIDPNPYNEKNLTMVRGNVMPFRFEGNCPQHYQQMQQYYQNAKNLSGNNGEGDTGPYQRIEASQRNFERAGGDTCGNMEGQMTEGKVRLQSTPLSQFNIHEARTIGGVRYLARKQDYLPNQQNVAPETLMTNGHLQPPVIY